MELGLKGKVAIVGGASKGLGRACALELAREGTRVAICSRNRETLERAAAEIKEETGNAVLAVPGDLTRYEDIKKPHIHYSRPFRQARHSGEQLRGPSRRAC